MSRELIDIQKDQLDLVRRRLDNHFDMIDVIYQMSGVKKLVEMYSSRTPKQLGSN